VSAAAPAIDALLLCGPTASGKSGLALALAAALAPGQRVEIVSVDSAQVYRGLDIGTAKPSAAERAAIPHHLIDLRDPEQTYSAGEFVADAIDAIRDIRSRGGLPLLVGGTLLYFNALLRGIAALPRADAGVRASLDARAEAMICVSALAAAEEAAAMAATRHLVKSRDTAKDAALRSYNHRRNLVHYVCDNAAKV
jgi:tRNA dimethylallyltransferase